MSELALRPTPPPARGVQHLLTMTARSLRLSARTVDALLTALLLPVLVMLLFVYLFGGAIETGTDYVTYVVPGVIIMCAGFGAAHTAVTVTTDLSSGVVDRFRALDVGGAAVLGGHVVASTARNLVSTGLVVGVAVAIGFRPQAGPLEWVAVLGVLAAFLVALSWLAATVGLLASTPEAAGGFTFLLIFLPYPSSAFVPVATMPSWIHGFAAHQPVTPVIETVRALLLDLPLGASPWRALAWCLAIGLASVLASAALFRRRTS